MKISSQMGRYFYWRTHREMLEIIAQDILKNQINGFHIVPPIKTTQLGYPVFSYIDPTNGVNLVVFSHWLTPPKRRGGFIYVQQENDGLSWLLTVKLEQHKKIGDKWYEYKGWVSDSYTEW